MVLKDDSDLESTASGYKSIKEIDEVSTLVGMLKKVDPNPDEIVKNRERLTFILSKYRDQSPLLVPYLNEILRLMLDTVTDKRFSENIKHNILDKIIQQGLLKLGKSYLLLNTVPSVAAILFISNILNRSDVADNIKGYGQLVLDKVTKMIVQKKSKL